MAAIHKSLLLLIFFLLLPQLVNSQQLLIKKKVSIAYNNERLEDVLLSLADAGGFSFSYNPDLLPVDSLISLQVQNSSVKSILNALLGEELEYKISGNLLVILKTKFTTNQTIASSGNKKTNVVDGYLKNAETGESVSNTIVYDVLGLKSTRTNEEGFFSLEIPVREEVIAIGVGSNNFKETAVVLINKDQNINIPVIPSKGVNAAGNDGLFEGARKVNEMKVVRFLASNEGLETSGNLALSNYRFAQTSFVPFIGTNLKMSGTVENKLSLNVLAGYNGASNGLEIGGLLNINRFYSRGAQVAGIGNIVGSETNGLQLSGIFNTNFGFVKGLQIAGINNLVLDSLQGVQIAGINNVVLGSTTGVQISGINNFARNDVDGVQIAGISNIALQDANKVQIAGIVNIAAKVKGIQLAGVGNTATNMQSIQIGGVFNYAADTVTGIQLASILNFAQRNEGLQLAFINVGKSSSGTSIGLLNFFWEGYNKIELAGNEILPMNVRVNFGNRKFYNTIGLGTKGFAKNQVWGYTYGIGSVFAIGKKENDLNLSLSVTDLQDDDSWFEEVNLNTRLGATVGFHINSRMMVYGGPVWSQLIYTSDRLQEDSFLEDLAPYTLYKHESGSKSVEGWIGFEFGIRLL